MDADKEEGQEQSEGEKLYGQWVQRALPRATGKIEVDGQQTSESGERF